MCKQLFLLYHVLRTRSRVLNRDLNWGQTLAAEPVIDKLFTTSSC